QQLWADKLDRFFRGQAPRVGRGPWHLFQHGVAVAPAYPALRCPLRDARSAGSTDVNDLLPRMGTGRATPVPEDIPEPPDGLREERHGWPPCACTGGWACAGPPRRASVCAACGQTGQAWSPGQAIVCSSPRVIVTVSACSPIPTRNSPRATN